MKSAGDKISMLTAYDFSFAGNFDAAGIDVLLVGDSASKVMVGNETTLSYYFRATHRKTRFSGITGQMRSYRRSLFI